MNIGTTFLVGYDICKNTMSPELCRQKAMDAAPNAVSVFLQSYDACLMVTDPDRCRKILAPDIPAPPVIPFISGLIIGIICVLIFRPSKKPLKE